MSESVWGLWHWTLKIQVTEQSSRPARTSYCPMRWSRAHLKINASKRNQHLTWLIDISYEGWEESLNLAPEGFGRLRESLIWQAEERLAHFTSSFQQLCMTSLPLWSAAQSSQDRVDLPRKVHRHMADTTTTPPTGWGLAPHRVRQLPAKTI